MQGPFCIQLLLKHIVQVEIIGPDKPCKGPG